MRCRILRIACATALAVAFTVSLSQTAHASGVTAPSVPADIQAPPGNKAFLAGHAIGTQNYICRPSGSGVAFVLFTPQATLFSGDDEQVTTHFFSPTPFRDNSNPALVADGMIGATWQHSRDTSTVWAKVNRSSFIQRVNTSGGVVPSTGCTSSTDVGNEAFVPYTADYFFYKDDGN